MYRNTGQKFFQGIRCDFCYDEHQTNKSGKYFLYIIYTEFLDSDGNVILDRNVEVSPKGHAYMWIIFPKCRGFHLNKIKVGTKGYFMCGSRKLGEVTVTDIVGLQTNPKC